MKHYVCKGCGNLVAMINDSGKRLTCCDGGMRELTPKVNEEGGEKHTPSVKLQDGRVRVTVGSEDNRHPQTPEHAIAWVCLVTDRGSQRKLLRPDGKQEAVFLLEPGEKVIKAFAYCNVHGLWVAECR